MTHEYSRVDEMKKFINRVQFINGKIVTQLINKSLIIYTFLKLCFCLWTFILGQKEYMISTSQSRTESLSFAPHFASQQRLDVSFKPIVSTSKSRKYLHKK